jgi:hypothetical protein
MRKLRALAAFVLSLGLGFARAASAEVTFRPVDVYVDSGETKLAAYQVEIRYDRERVKIVGLEGGETKAFNAAPFYDRAGLDAGRIVIAAFIPEDVDLIDAPKGRTRVARLHLQVEGPRGDEAVWGMTISLAVAADGEGKRILGRVQLVDGADDAADEDERGAGEESGR